jgi:hypothetical protein
MSNQTNHTVVAEEGISPGLRWTQEMADKAREDKIYLRVGGKKVATRVLGSAPRTSWSKVDNPDEANSIFVPKFRITGTEENVVEALSKANISNEEIKEALRAKITKENYTNTMDEVFKKESDEHKPIKKEKPDGYPEQILNELARSIKAKQYKIVPKGEPATRNALHTRGESLKTKIQKIMEENAEKVVDVSGIDQMTGVGYHITNQPKSFKSGKYWVDGLPLMSNSLDKYLSAIQIIFGETGETTYAQEIIKFKELLRTRPAHPPKKAVETQASNANSSTKTEVLTKNEKAELPADKGTAKVVVSKAKTEIPLQPSKSANSNASIPAASTSTTSTLSNASTASTASNSSNSTNKSVVTLGGPKVPIPSYPKK